MAAVDFSKVVELCEKAVAASRSHREASAADYFGAAALAARALELPADSLIHAFLGVEQVVMLEAQADLAGQQSAGQSELKDRRLSILDAVLPVLLRRRAACMVSHAGRSVAEHAFALAYSETEGKVSTPVLPYPPTESELRGRSAFLYYETYLTAAQRALTANPEVETGQGARDLLRERLRTYYDFGASALDLLLTVGQYLMAQLQLSDPRRPAEIHLLQTLRVNEEGLTAMLPLTANLVASWQRLKSSGILATRDIGGQYTKMENNYARMLTESAAKATKLGLRTCALASCTAREVHVSHFKRCAGCKAVVYCSKPHQLADWPAHKAACKAARKAAADSTQTA